MWGCSPFAACPVREEQALWAAEGRLWRGDQSQGTCLARGATWEVSSGTEVPAEEERAAACTERAKDTGRTSPPSGAHSGTPSP